MVSYPVSDAHRFDFVRLLAELHQLVSPEQQLWRNLLIFILLIFISTWLEVGGHLLASELNLNSKAIGLPDPEVIVQILNDY